MVLRSDRHSFRFNVFDRLVGSPVTEFQFVCVCPNGMGQDLMPKTNPEHGIIGHELTDGFVGVIQSGRVTRSVGEENGIGVVRLGFFCRCIGGQDDHLESVSAQVLVDRFFGSVVKGHETMSFGESAFIGLEVVP